MHKLFICTAGERGECHEDLHMVLHGHVTEDACRLLLAAHFLTLCGKPVMKRERDDGVERVTQGRALGAEFCLSARDLASLPFDEVPNPHFRRAGAPMKLYKLSDVTALSHAKHGGPVGVEEAAAKRFAQAERRRNTVKAKSEERRAQLEAALGVFRLELRSDSSLCNEFIRCAGRCDWTIDRVVRRMAEMRFLHEHTSYRNVLHDIRDEYRDMGERWDAKETAREAEALAVARVGGWPARWPWMGLWTKDTHRAFSKRMFRDPVKALLLSLMHTPLGSVDPETRAGIVQNIVSAFSLSF